jgi:hypothetical protein
MTAQISPPRAALSLAVVVAGLCLPKHRLDDCDFADQAAELSIGDVEVTPNNRMRPELSALTKWSRYRTSSDGFIDSP